LGVLGAKVSDMVARLAADLAVRGANVPYKAMLVNLGVNDMAAMPAEAAWEADLATILDAAHAKWPTMKVYVMRPWMRGKNAESNTMAGWIATVLSTRGAWAFAGPDERVFLENGDDGVTYTSDGVHPTNPAGYALTAAQWKTVLGY
jgi:lysophospholipase L1-like esterase